MGGGAAEDSLAKVKRIQRLRARKFALAGPQPRWGAEEGSALCARCWEVSPVIAPRRSSPPWRTWQRAPGARSTFRAPRDGVWRGARDTDARATKWKGDGVARHVPAEIRVGSDDLGDVHLVMMRRFGEGDR
jgi:hypothetical protein